MEEAQENVNRDRIVYDYKHAIIQSVEHDNHGPESWTYAEARNSKAFREQYSERGRQLDENEAVCKEQYDTNHCEEVTGLSSDGYRHQVIEEYTHDQMAEKAASQSQGSDYWDDAAKGNATETSAQQTAQSDYWASAGASNESSVSNEMSSEKSNETSNSL